MKRYMCELVGTFFLVFAGTGAIIANDVYGGSLGGVGIAMSFGLVVMAVIYAVGDTSGAHINPAVTLGFYVNQRIGRKDMIGYIAFQCIGGIFASLLLRIVFPGHTMLGATLPTVSIVGAFIYEYLMTFFLMLVILSVATGAKEKGFMAGVAIGGTVGLEALFGGPVTGASMNPARSLGPALVSGEITHLWIYLVATSLGAVTAVPICRLLHIQGCCKKEV